MGTTRYPDGQYVMPGDKITEQKVFECQTYDLAAAESAVSRLVTAEIGQHQHDALVSFTYNLGALAFGNSNLLRAVNTNPASQTIDKQFITCQSMFYVEHNPRGCIISDLTPCPLYLEERSGFSNCLFTKPLEFLPFVYSFEFQR
jgi:hypothetical protein